MDTEHLFDDLRSLVTTIVPERIRDLLDRNGIRQEVDFNPRNLSFITQHDNGLNTFRFSGAVFLNGDPMIEEITSIPTASILNIRVPSSLREQGLGTHLVRGWEEIFREVGITSFSVSGIQPTEEALDFWRSLDYQVPSSLQGVTHPTRMYKKITTS